MASVKVEEGGTWEVPDSSFTNPSGLFVGWARTPDAPSPEYYSGDSLTYEVLRALGTNLTLYALWDTVSYRIDYKPGEGTGSMPSSFHDPGQDAALSPCAFTKYDSVFTGWLVQGTDTVYDDEASIPSGTYKAGDVVTLVAQFQANEHTVQLEDNELAFELKGGERAVFDDLPAGTGYQVWEETENGWLLVGETGTDGEIEPTKISEAWFHNRYTPGTVSVQFMAEKTLDGAAPAAGQFGFELTESDGTVSQNVSNSAAGTVSFLPIVYEEAGDHTYEIREKAGEDGTIEYDDAVYTAAVSVTDDGEGNLDAEVVYRNSAGEAVERPVFANSRKSGSLRISKDASGNTSTEFSFVLSLADKGGLPFVPEELPDGLTEVEGTPGSFRFTLRGGEELAVTDLPAGTSYAVREVNIPGGWTAEEASMSGRIEAAAESRADFVNTYTVGSVSGTDVGLVAYKFLEGKRLSSGDFTFVLEEKSVADGEETWTSIQEKTNTDPDPFEEVFDDGGNAVPNPWFGAGMVRFDIIHYSGPGSHIYRIREAAGEDEHMTYDDTVYTVRVDVEDAGDGTLRATAFRGEGAEEALGDDYLVFTNKVIPGTLTVEKTVENTTPVSEQTGFTFTLSAKDTDGEPFVFPEVPEGLTAVEGTPGSYRFTLKGGESLTVEGLPYGCVYSVEEDEAAGFTSQAVNAFGEILTEDVTASFTNTYSAGGSVEVPVAKLLTGGDIPADTFVLEISGDGIQPRTVSVPAAAREGDTARSDFAIKLEYNDIADHGQTYRYSIREVAGDQEAFIYDDRVVTGSVTVEDMGDGTLKAEWTFDEEGLERAEFSNRRLYELTVGKEAASNLGESERDFEFTAVFDGLPEGFALAVPEGWELRDGKYVFRLGDGQTTSVRLPYGATYSIREEVRGYSARWVVRGADGQELASGRGDSLPEQTLQGDESVTFTNTLNAVIPTGVRVAGGACVLLVSLAGLGMGLIIRRKKRL